MNTVPLIDLGYEWKQQQKEIEEAFRRVIESGQYILGPEVEQLEQEMAAFCGTPFAIGVANGTDALTLLLKSFDIGPGDEVITSPFTFFATAEAILNVGATAVFADVDLATFNISPKEVERKISSRTKAILPVHIFGQMADMRALKTLAVKHQLYLFEDACQAIGARFENLGVGVWSDGAAISFFPTKNLGSCGDGGMVVLHDADRAQRIQRLRIHGSRAKYIHDEAGWNSRLDEIHAAILRVKLTKLAEWNEERRRLAAKYHEAFKRLPLQLPLEQKNAHHVYHLYTVMTEERDLLIKHLKSQGIGCGVYYPVPLHLQKALQSAGKSVQKDLPNAEYAALHCLSLPLYPGLSAKAQKAVIQTVSDFFER